MGVGEGYSRGLSVFGIGNFPAPGTTAPVTVSTSDPRLNLDFSKTSNSRVPDLTKKQMAVPDWTGNTTVYLPQSQPVVEQIQQQLKPGQGYIFTPEEQAQFLDPYGDLLWQQYASKKQPAKGGWFS